MSGQQLCILAFVFGRLTSNLVHKIPEEQSLCTYTFHHMFYQMYHVSSHIYLYISLVKKVWLLSPNISVWISFFLYFSALLVFVVPADSGEKVTLGVSAMLNMIVFMMNVREDLPPTDKPSLISKKFNSIVQMFESPLISPFLLFICMVTMI